jgi:hypothetical protein
MFCPFCGATLAVGRSERWGTLVECLPGEMSLSENMRQVLEQRYGPASAGVANPADTRRTCHLGRWFCPGCGVQLDRQMQCPQCGKSLRDQLYRLVEFHPHRHD